MDDRFQYRGKAKLNETCTVLLLLLLLLLLTMVVVVLAEDNVVATVEDVVEVLARLEAADAVAVAVLVSTSRWVAPS